NKEKNVSMDSNRRSRETEKVNLSSCSSKAGKILDLVKNTGRVNMMSCKDVNADTLYHRAHQVAGNTRLVADGARADAYRHIERIKQIFQKFQPNHKALYEKFNFFYEQFDSFTKERQRIQLEMEHSSDFMKQLMEEITSKGTGILAES